MSGRSGPFRMSWSPQITRLREGPAPEVHVGHVVANQLDLAGVGHAEAPLVGHPEVRDPERVVAHQARRDRVDRHGVGRGEDQVALAWKHGAGPRAVPHHGAVHDGEHGRVELPLHVEQIDQDLMDELVRVVAHLLQEATERVLDALVVTEWPWVLWRMMPFPTKDEVPSTERS